MKISKRVALLAVAALSVGVLAACSNNSSGGTSSSSASGSSTSQLAPSSSASAQSASNTDVTAGATAGTTDFTTLRKGSSSTGIWLNAITADMDASGKTLTVDGTFKNDQGQVARKLALYNQDSKMQVTAQYTLTLSQLVVNSPNFYLSNGNIKGDVLVNADGFWVQRSNDTTGNMVTVTITGNLKFKTQAQLDAYNKLPAEKKPTVTGTIGLQ